jgi:hypothetical protein
MIRLPQAALWFALAGLAGCVDVNGGAVEFKWEIRKDDGTGSSCDGMQVAAVRVIAEPTPDSNGATTGELFDDSWPCTDYKAATDFVIEPGRYAIRIEPVCPAGLEAVATVPQPIVRDVSNGYVVELNTLLIEKRKKAGDTTGLICQPPAMSARPSELMGPRTRGD